MQDDSWLIKAAQHRQPEIDTQDLNLSVDPIESWEQVKDRFSLSSAELVKDAADYLGIPPTDLRDHTISTVRLVPEEIARKFNLLPLKETESTISIAISTPEMSDIEMAVRFGARRQVEFFFAAPDDIETCLSDSYAHFSGQASSNIQSLDISDTTLSSAGASPGGKSTVKLAHTILQKAIIQRASDIHIQSFAGGGIIRFRIDGVLKRVVTIPYVVYDHLVRYLKVLGKMDIIKSAEPQDGRSSLLYKDREFDLRISVLPNRGGESVVIRLLERASIKSLAESNFSLLDRQTIERLVQDVSGMLLMTGPTGSGKTSTLYSVLSDLNTFERSIITIEDPVEYVLAGTSQIEVNPEVGMTFPRALRSILRQDPDIVLVGEIRDAETAAIAAQAAMTGHLVFSTLHTNDALSAIPRLIDLGVNPTVIADSLMGVVAQRLLRRLCEACKQPAAIPLQTLEQEFQLVTGESAGFRKVGCKECSYTGYHDRIPVVEIIEMNHELRSALMIGNIGLSELQKVAASHFTSIASSAANWIISGSTTVDEAFRVLGYRFWNQLANEHGRSYTHNALASAVAMSDKSARREILLFSTQEDQLVSLAGDSSLCQHYKFHTATTPAQAHKLLETEPHIVALVLDLENDKGEAINLLTKLRAELSWSGLPAILAIDERDQKLQEIILKLAVTDYIRSPIDPQKLQSFLDNILGHSL